MKAIYLDQIDSTNEFLKRLPVNDEMVFVHTNIQTNGKGYYGNKWVSKAGDSLTFSFSKRVEKDFNPQKFNFWLSSKIASYLKNSLNLNIKLKWPNDLILNNKKMGGILSELVLSGDKVKFISGIGLNLNQKKFNNLPEATSVYLETKKETEVRDAFSKIASFLCESYNSYETSTLKSVLEDYNSKLYKKNKESLFSANNLEFKGIIRKVDKNGLLCVEQKGKDIRKYQHKEISMVLK